MVYAFIVTPVQLWHHHAENAVVARSEICSLATTHFSENLPQDVEANCSICSHHYAAYHAVENIVLNCPVTLLEIIDTRYSFQIPSSPYLLFGNKGPPQFA